MALIFSGGIIGGSFLAATIQSSRVSSFGGGDVAVGVLVAVRLASDVVMSMVLD